MPLSERERRILEEIERNLYDEDPAFARGVKREAPKMAERRKVKGGAATFGLGFALLIGFFLSGNVLVGVAAFVVMVGGIFLIAGSLPGSLSPRRPKGPGPKDRVSGFIATWEQKVRDRYKRS